MTISYEWDIETIDEYGDVLDHDHSDKRPTRPLEANEKLCLVRDTGNDLDGLLDRQWAYVDARGNLPSHFSMSCQQQGARVPKRFS